jgi:aryl-alcohol dehydrogenase-like predicted oxidoreductase
MLFGQWEINDVAQCTRMVDIALDAGVNFIDTADVYSLGESEEIVGAALAGRRDRVVLATKVHSAMGTDPNERGSSRRWIRRAVEASLRRLRTDRIDLYQVHRPDHSTDLEQTLSVLTDLVREGKVLAIGSSTFPAERIVEAQWVAERHGLERFQSDQLPYSLLNRAVEAAALPTCQRHGLAATVWSPLSGGWLSGHPGGPEGADRTSERARRLPGLYDMSLEGNRRKVEAVAALRRLADDVGVSLPQLALSFVCAHPGVTSVILGPRSLDQLTELLAGGDVALSDETLDRIDEIVPPGVSLNFADRGYLPPALADPSLRRRQLTDRAAG